MTDTIDYFEIAKRLTRAHSELAGQRYLEGRELEDAKRLVSLLVDQIWHMAQTGHQAWHQTEGGRFADCSMAFCQDATRVLGSLPIGRDQLVAGLRRELGAAQEYIDHLEGEIMEAWENEDWRLLRACNDRITCPTCGDYCPRGKPCSVCERDP